MRAEAHVVVVGGGHAGCEAALAAARLGVRTTLVTNDPGTIARMSCNPAIGGLAKGQVVREIDALGGAMPLVADRTGIQFKVLNASRGPAVRGPRCQSDKAAYAREMRRLLEATPNLRIARGSAADLCFTSGRLSGVQLEDGSRLACGAAVVTSGTFLRGVVHVGDLSRDAGRWEEPPARTLSDALLGLGLRLGRMKTGTPPRVRRGTIDVGRMEPAPGDARPRPFSARSRRESFPRLPQVSCWLTRTNGATHELIRRHLHASPLYSGRITGRGPRYCPSIEDKVVRFPDRESHQVFVEPEGLETEWTYLNGLSMSLPEAIQKEIVRSISGLEAAEFLRPAYAVEYDVVLSEQLTDILEVRERPGLFLAGQINGTSGYEEAAGQGLIAGINAARRAADGEDAEPFRLGRHEAYIGVMIDDLVTLGADEPYRLLTSRAEYRLLLGADTVHRRLTARAAAAGLVSPNEAEILLEREERLSAAREALEEVAIRPDSRTVATLARAGVSLRADTTLAGLLRRPDVDVSRLLEVDELEATFATRGLIDAEDLDRVVTDLRYEGFVRREEEGVRRLAAAQERPIPPDFRFTGIPGLSSESVEKLERHRPRTIGQAGRIPGITPAAAALLLARVLAAREVVS